MFEEEKACCQSNIDPYDEEDLAREFRVLTIYDRKLNDDVEEFVSAIKRLEGIGLFRQVGKDIASTLK